MVLLVTNLALQKSITVLTLKSRKMKYKVHRFEIHMDKDQMRLEEFLNTLRGEVVSIVPKNRSISLAQIYGVSRKVDFLLIIEKLNS